jgi:hypothetical protein
VQLAVVAPDEATDAPEVAAPAELGQQPQQGPLAGLTADLEAQVYWNLGALDWDRVTTKPSKAKLLELGLDDVAKDLWP